MALTKPKESESIAAATAEVLAAAAYEAYIREPVNADAETQQYARGHFINGFLRGYAVAKGK